MVHLRSVWISEFVKICEITSILITSHDEQNQVIIISLHERIFFDTNLCNEDKTLVYKRTNWVNAEAMLSIGLTFSLL